MDANGTRYHVLLGYSDWANCTDGRNPLALSWESSPLADDTSGLMWDSSRQEVTLQGRLFQFAAGRGDTGPSLDARRGAARDRFGNWYWIDETRRGIRINLSGSGATTQFWASDAAPVCPPMAGYGEFGPQTPPPAPSPLSLSGLAITEDHYLVVGVVKPAGLLIFDLFAGGAPRQLLWPVSFTPFDMAARPGGGVWILDQAGRRYWALDRHFNVIRNDQPQTTLAEEQALTFQPQEGGLERRASGRTFPLGITLEVASPLDDVDLPIAIEALPDETVLILDGTRPFARVFRYHYGQLLGAPVSTAEMKEYIDEKDRGRFELVAHDFAFVPEHNTRDGALIPDQLIIAAAHGNQSYAFDITQVDSQLIMRPARSYLPMRLFGGKGVVAAGNQAYYDFDERWVPLVEQRRPLFVPEAFLYTPSTENGPLFDSRQPDCVWHRLMLDACLPPTTGITVWSRAADDLAGLALAQWQLEPTPYRRGSGSELPFARQGNRPHEGTWELLLQRARGRYLQLRLQLRGNGQNTPSLRALRAYYPRFAYADHYLPAIYRSDGPASFLERFLANVEGLLTALEDQIAASQVLFDVRGAPAEALDWLASWYGMALDPTWDVTRRRLFIQYAMIFFQHRGTALGLQMALQVALSDCLDETIFTAPAARAQRSGMRIVELYRTRLTPSVVLGDPTAATGLRLTPPTARWNPQQGGSLLHQRYAEFRTSRELPAAAYPLSPPPEQAALWQEFSQAVLGFTPSATAADLLLWHGFLSRRYPTPAALNTAYQLSTSQQVTAITEVGLPTALPPDGPPLYDWYEFEAVLLPMWRAAHRFTVLLPVPRGGFAEFAELQERRELARRVVELEKPAHTVFDVKFYWAMFRVGEVRLGYDTVLGQGSRAPELMTPLVLGQAYLSESYLAPAVERRPPVVVSCQRMQEAL